MAVEERQHYGQEQNRYFDGEGRRVAQRLKALGDRWEDYSSTWLIWMTGSQLV